MNWFRGELFKVLFGARHRLVIQRCLTTIKMDDILLKHRVKLDHKQLPLIVIIGATGCGKTKLSIELAQKYNGEVINADAMQIYKGLDIATNKATMEERCGIKHHLFDFVDPFKQFTVVDFQKMALETIDSIVKKGKVPILVGGTNYYIEAILWDTLVNSNTEEDISVLASEQAVRSVESVQDLLKTPISYKNLTSMASEKLYEFLNEIDPEYAKTVPGSNRRKVIRALQVYQQTGNRFSDILQQQRSAGSRHGGPLRFANSIIFWLDCEKPDERLNRRVDEMLRLGLVEELRKFHESYNNLRIKENRKVDYTEGIFQAIGLKEFHKFLILNEEDRKSYEGQLKLGNGILLLKQRTQSYVTKQLKWIRRRFLVSETVRQVPNVYRLDTTVPEVWPAEVLEKATNIVDHCLQAINCEDNHREHIVNEILKPLSAKVVVDGEEMDQFISSQHYCEVCQVWISGGKSYQIHLESKKHKFQLKQINKQTD